MTTTCSESKRTQYDTSSGEGVLKSVQLSGGGVALARNAHPREPVGEVEIR